METGSIGFLAGTIFCILGFLLGRLSNVNNNQRELNDDSDINIYIPVRCRGRSSNNRYNKKVEVEEMIFLLDSLNCFCSCHEKYIMNAIKDKITGDE